MSRRNVRIPQGFNATASDMRRIRQRVRSTASLVSTGGRIREMPGPNWAADYASRTIYWRPTDPYTRMLLHDEEVLMNTVHEAGHLNWTGGFRYPEGVVRYRFHRCWNAVEDIRIERLLSRDFPGFVSVRTNSNAESIKFHRRGGRSHHYGLVDQVALSWLGLAEGLGGIGTPIARTFAEATWSAIDRIANSHDSASVAEGIEPIYRELERAMKEQRDPDVDNLPDGWDDAGLDELTEHPSRSDMPSKEEQERRRRQLRPDDGEEGAMGTADLPSELLEILQQMADDAEDSGQIFILEWVQNERNAQDDGTVYADVLVDSSTVPGNGDEPPCNRGDLDAWRRAAESVRRGTAVLERQLLGKLRTNADDDWQGGLRRGQLDIAAAPRSVRGDVNVFRERHAVGSLDYNFMLTVDVSSSQMSRAREVLHASVMMLEALERAELGNACIPWRSVPGVLYPFSASLNGWKPYLGSVIAHPHGGTYEAPALIAAIDEFAGCSRHAGNVLITVTDGDTHGQDESVALMEELYRMGVACFGIGVGCDAPRHYEHRHSVTDPHELATLLPRIVSQRVRRGHQ